VVGGLGAIGAGLYSIGIPKDSVVKYETAIKSDKFLVLAHGHGRRGGQGRKTLCRQLARWKLHCTSSLVGNPPRPVRGNAPAKVQNAKEGKTMLRNVTHLRVLRSEPGMGRLEHWISSILTMRAGLSATWWLMQGIG